jgi:predicted acyltransferase
MPYSAPTAEVAPPPPVGSTRLVSLDVLRGFDMFWILGADIVMRKLGETTGVFPFTFLARQLEHTAWAGLTFYDVIFPLFLFVAGVSLVFSLGQALARESRGRVVRRILVRGAVLFVLGIIYNGGLTNPWPEVRLLGVLQRIALAYTATALLFCFLTPRALARTGVVILMGYWALLTFVPIRPVALDRSTLPAAMGLARLPTPAEARVFYEATGDKRVHGGYSPGQNLANHLDFEHLPGRLHYSYWDPEGMLSTLPAIASCLIGVFAGLLLRRGDVADAGKIRRLVIAGVGLLALGWLWHLQFPVVKKIWTSSYVLVTGGWSLLLLAGFYYVIDVRLWRGAWCAPFLWIGMNPITLYLANNFLGLPRNALRLAGGDVKLFFEHTFSPAAGDLVVETTALGLMVLLAWFLYRRQIFLRV